MLKAGTKVSKYWGAGPELRGIVLADDDIRVWEGTDFEALEPELRAAKTHEMFELCAERPVYYAQGRGKVWEKAELLFKLRG